MVFPNIEEAVPSEPIWLMHLKVEANCFHQLKIFNFIVISCGIYTVVYDQLDDSYLLEYMFSRIFPA